MTISPDEAFYERAMERVVRVTLWLSLAGVVAVLALGGWAPAVGFAVGAAASWLNFRVLKQVADALGGGRIRRRLVAFAAARYLLFGVGAYAIFRFSPISLPAALAGLFVSVAAVIVVAVLELAYARN